MKKTSWKTTTTGILSILIAAGSAAQAVINGGQVDWTATLAAIMAGIGLISARDNKVSSEDVGAK